jgi:hypothetical protein
VVTSTVLVATSYVALLFWKALPTCSPFHIQDHKVLHPSVKQLLNAFENLDPPPHRQKAITPKFLRVFHQLSGAGSPDTRDTAPAVAATLLILAFFFAMRSCEHTTTPNPGRTQKLNVGHVVFCDKCIRMLPFDCPILEAKYVTFTKDGRTNPAANWRSRALPCCAGSHTDIPNLPDSTQLL